MVTAQVRLTSTGLEARRTILRRELSRVDRQIRQTEQAQARLVERIKSLEQGRRQAA
jgi:hypothetical protein